MRKYSPGLRFGRGILNFEVSLATPSKYARDFLFCSKDILEASASKQKSREFYMLRYFRRLAEMRIKCTLKVNQNAKIRLEKLVKVIKECSQDYEDGVVMHEAIVDGLTPFSFSCSVFAANVRTLTIQQEKGKKSCRGSKEKDFAYQKLPLICEECVELGLMIGCLSEHRLNETHSEVGQCCYLVFDEYEFFYSPCEKNAVGGVGILLAKNCDFKECIWKRVSSRLIWVIGLLNGVKIAIFAVYAPTNEANEVEREIFYVDLEREQRLVPEGVIRILLGDYNARIGIDHDNEFENLGVRGSFGCSKDVDANGELLLEFCVKNKMVIADSLFDRPNNDFGTWRFKGEFFAAIDHVLVGWGANCASRGGEEWSISSCGVLSELDICLESDHRAVGLVLECTTTLSEEEKRRLGGRRQERRKSSKELKKTARL